MIGELVLHRSTFERLLDLLSARCGPPEPWAALFPDGRILPLEVEEAGPGRWAPACPFLLVLAEHPGTVVCHAHTEGPPVLSDSDRLGAKLGGLASYDVLLVVVVPEEGSAAAYRWDASRAEYTLVPLRIEEEPPSELHG